MSFDPLPVIAVNGKSPWNRRIFTLLHEYAHLLQRTSGLCDLHEDLASRDDRDRAEASCNRLAADILVPRAIIKSRAIYKTAPSGSEGWETWVLRDEARFFGVSAEVILRRLFDPGKTTPQFYEKWRSARSNFEASEKRKQSGGDPYRTKVRNLGKGYVRAVIEGHSSGVISSFEAAGMLNTKVDYIPKLADRARVPGGE